MNIVIDGRSSLLYEGSGIGNYTIELIKNLYNINSNHVIDVYKEFDSKKSLPFWKEVNNPLKLTKDYDVLLNPHNGIGLPEKTMSKIITTLHDIIPSKIPHTVSETYLSIYNENIKKVLDKSDVIITVSNFSKKDMINEFNIKEDKIKVTYLSPSNIYKPLDKNLSKEILKKEYKIDFPYVLYIGSFSPRKNILNLIRAFSKVCIKNKDIKLVIIGKKGEPYYKYLNECIKLNIKDRVIFTGFIKTHDLPYFYNSSLLFVYPSFYEGFGLPPLEAMASGTPSIVSNVTSMPEILKDHAVYINPYDADDIYEKIYDLIINDPLRDNIINRGLKYSKNFSWEKTSKETLKIIEKIRDS